MKKLLFLVGVCIGFQTQVAMAQFSFASDFSPGQLPLIDQSAAINGSWHGDIFQNGAGFQEIGGLGLAMSDGIAYSQMFAPVDLTQGYGSFGVFQSTIQNPNPSYDPSRPPGPFNPPFLPPTVVTVDVHCYTYLTAATGQSPPQPFRLTLYDMSGGSSHWDVTTSAPVGQFGTYDTSESGFSGNLDWTHVDQFSLSGVGGSEPFHAAFDNLQAIPEPGSTGIVIAIALLAFGGWRWFFLTTRQHGCGDYPESFAGMKPGPRCGYQDGNSDSMTTRHRILHSVTSVFQ